MNLSGLSPELLEEIVGHLTKRDVNALIQTDRHFHRLFIKSLYHEDPQSASGDLEEATALRWAVKYGRLDTIQRALSLGVRLGDDPVLLPKAVYFGQNHLLRFLLESNAFDINLADRHDSKAPLCRAAEKGNTTAIRLLLEHGADLSVRDDEEMTPLNLAARSGFLEAVNLLLDAGSDLGDLEGDNISALESAAFPGHYEIVELLLKRGASVTGASDVTPVHIAAYCGQAAVLDLLLLKGGGLETRTGDGWTPLHHAVVQGKPAAVKVLLEHGADIKTLSPNDTTSLRIACEKENAEIAEMLLEYGADLADEDLALQPLINLGAASPDDMLSKVLLRYGANIEEADAQGFTPLIVASSEGSMETARQLLASGANIEAATSRGHRALHVAAGNGRTDIVELLLEKGANTMLADALGRTPAHLAASNGHFAVIKLLSEDSDINLLDNNGRTPFFYAAMHDHCDVLSVLLCSDGDADVDKVGLEGARANLSGNVKDIFGAMPVLAAAKNGHENAVKTILHADKSSLSNLGSDLLYWASRSGNTALVSFLRGCSKDRGIHITEDHLPEGQKMLWRLKNRCYCDVCTRCSIHGEGTEAFRCTECDGGHLLICGECRDAGAKCRDESHTWEPYSCSRCDMIEMYMRELEHTHSASPSVSGED